MKNKILLFTATIIATVLFYSIKSTAIPKPTGTYSIGRTTIHLIDKLRQESHNPTHHRELLLQVWYPSQSNMYAQKSLYAPYTGSYIKNEIAQATKQDPISFAYIESLTGHASDNAPVSINNDLYPVIIFSPGFGSPVVTYTSLLEELASHGYIVIGINYPYVTNPVVFPDGRIVEQLKERVTNKQKELPIWIRDIQFVIDQLKIIQNDNSILKNRLDINNIGLLGHSFGGSATVALCAQDNRCKAGVDLDGKIPNTDISHMHQPFLFLTAPHDEKILQPMISFTKNNPTIKYIIINDIDHGSFTDLYLLSPHWPNRPQSDPTENINKIREYIVCFFNNHLKK